jgi:DNA end-binding protein Ku
MAEEEVEESFEGAPAKRAIWEGGISIGLVNIPVKLQSMIFDNSIRFRFLHKKDGQPLKYQKVCIKDNSVVAWEDTAKGFEVSKGEFVVFDKSELDALRVESDRLIRVSKFVDYLAVDPVYFGRSYILLPNKSGEAYRLLMTTLERMGKAAVGRVTLRTKEYPALIHVYKGGLILTTLRYAYEVADPHSISELRGLKEPRKEEVDLAMVIVKDLSGEFDIKDFKDGYKEKLEELIEKKQKGEKIVAEQPVKEEAKELMAALQETLSQLKKK